jgi:molecular chaperone GrpE
MTSGKRQIPINNHGPDAGEPRVPAGEPGARTASATASTEGVAAARAAKPEPSRAEGAAQATEAAVGDKEMPLDDKGAAAGERDGLADSLLRLRAEFENYRKRASRELLEARERAQGELLSELLPVLDNLERALDAAEHHDEGKVLGGVRMTRKQFVDLLAKVGVEEVEGVGTPFDPQIHDAMLVQPSEQDEGVVVEVLERGYRQGDRVLRPARVVVSAGRTGSGAPGSKG